MSFFEQRKLVLSFLQDYMDSVDKSYLNLMSCRNLLDLTGNEPLNKKKKEKAIKKVIKFNAEQRDLFRKTIDFVEQFYWNMVLPDSEKTDVAIPEGSMNFIRAAYFQYMNKLSNTNSYLSSALNKSECAKLHSNEVFERMENDANEAVKFIESACSIANQKQKPSATITFHYFSEKQPKHKQEVVRLITEDGFEPRSVTVEYYWAEVDINGCETGTRCCYHKGDELDDNYKLIIQDSNGLLFEDNSLWLPLKEYEIFSKKLKSLGK